MMPPMNFFPAGRRACLAALALACAAPWAQEAAETANPAAMLPQWAQDKLAAAKADPKLREQAYRQGEKLATFCANCHGIAGSSVKPEVPNLAGQNPVYVLHQLNKFHDGRRRGAFFMEGLVKAMSNDERFAVTVYFTSQEAKAQPAPDPNLAAQGKVLYEKGCRKCHDDNGAGSEKYSRVAGQQPDYLEKSIRRYRDNDVRADEKMFKVTKNLSDADIKALVAYIGSLR